ncbi:MAG TPA: hypothetical protein VFE90_23340 [Myxococcales bacterium]|nr:hypothetical protein [Myxococcales bacterium]
MKRTAMQKISGLLLVAAALAGCRSIPFYGGPKFEYQKESQEGVLGKKQDATLTDEGNHHTAGFRYELAAPGALIASARPVNPQAQITVAIYAEGSGDVPIAKGDPGKKAEANELQPGVYYVTVSEPWKDAVRTRVELRAIFKPQDPDAAQQACKTQATARELNPDKGQAEDGVDYSAQRRTCWWKVPLAAEGALSVKFDNNGNNLTAEFVPAQGAPEKIDPVAGLSKADLPAGDYFVKVYANDAGDAGRYRLATSFKIGDTCKNGGPACSLEGAEELKLPSDSKTADVDYSKSKQFHFYKASLKEKGKLTINFKVLQPQRGSKVAAYFMKTPDDEGDRIAGSSTKDIESPGDFFIRVQAPDTGDYGKYAISTIFQPSNFIPADVVEIGRSPCLLTVSAGTNQGVRAGLGCTVVNASGQALDSCVVDQTFPNLSKVKPASARCNVAPNSKVQINSQ